MKKRKTNPHIGSTLESFLKEEGIFEEVTKSATQRVRAWRIAEQTRESRAGKTATPKHKSTNRAS